MTIDWAQRPHHPAVDWSDHARYGRRWKVRVHCPDCPDARFLESQLVASLIRAGKFTGRCTAHQHSAERKNRLERPPHPAVNWDPVMAGRNRKVRVTCPGCSSMRVMFAGPVAAKVRAGTFTGLCLPRSPNGRKHEWVILRPGRKLDPVKWYGPVTLASGNPADASPYDPMRG